MSAETRHPPQATQGTPERAPRATLFGSITRILNVVGTVLILLMALAVNADITGRNAFNHPLPGVLEFVGLSIVAIVFLQMANTLREDRHVSNDILIRLVADTRPRLAAGLRASFHLIGAILMVLIVWFVWPILLQNYEGGYYRGTAGVIEVPIWPFVAAIIVGAAATAIQFLLIAWGGFVKAFGRGVD
jgi:TRAP-type C4-dicarboxylate transport system permease small subunit